MATTAKQLDRTATLSDLTTPPLPAVDIDAHRKDLERRAAERAAKRAILDECTNPLAAARHEAQKEHWYWKIKAKWIDAKHIYEAEETVIGQNESDAWSHFCDKLQTWPSRRNCRELTITKGKKVEMARVEQHIRAIDNGDDELGEREVIKLSAKKKT
jgi:hypothetical protein